MSYDCRNTTLLRLFVNTVSSSGIVQLGDGGNTEMSSWAIAVQRAVANFEDDEFFFESYPIFYLPKLVPAAEVPVSFKSESPWPTQHVGCVRSLGVSSSSTLRVGCSGPVEGVSRIKHIRHFNQPGYPLKNGDESP
ncbi:spore germination protein GerPE [Cohnella cellulosilytica]|uniref:Spore germination protein GerPE n=1 Tax=Cohnella cellulosilytica TaxID=986710 RepID=A0ABW2F7I7_9BACL